MNVRITSLKVFVDLAQTGSFSEAASRNDISQPAVSQQIGNLEEEFAVPLVERSRRRFRLTPAGEALLQTAQETILAMETLKRRMGELGHGVAGELQVATTFNLGMEWLPRLTMDLQSKYPQVRLEAVYRPANRIAAEVAGNVADFALMACPREDDRFINVTIAEETFCFVASRTSGLAGRHLAGAKQPFVAYAPDQPTAQMVENALSNLNCKAPAQLRFEHPETVVKAVLAINGFACLPRESVHEALARGELVEIFAGQTKVIRRIAAVFYKQRENNPLLRAVIEFLKTNGPSHPGQREIRGAIEARKSGRTQQAEAELSVA